MRAGFRMALLCAGKRPLPMEGVPATGPKSTELTVEIRNFVPNKTFRIVLFLISTLQSTAFCCNIDAEENENQLEGFYVRLILNIMEVYVCEFNLLKPYCVMQTSL